MTDLAHDTDTPLDRLDGLLIECLSHPAALQETALGELCRRHPAEATALRRRLEVLRKIGLVAPGAAPVLPESIGGFRIMRRLGEGGMGVVYLAEQAELGRRVALKVLRRDLLHFESSRERFRREALLAGRLEHPGLCPVYEVGEVDGVPFLAMRVIEGESLADRLERARQGVALPIDAAVGQVEQVARALHVAHEAGLVHRDVKPGNVMLGSEGPVLVDFGLARDVTAPGDLTLTGDAVGTPAYLAPEQLEAGSRIDRRTDVYALGVTLYECLALRSPFDIRDREALNRQIRRGEARDLETVRRGLPRDLRAIVARAMERNPQRRYASALELAEDLHRFRAGEPVHARPLGIGARGVRWLRRNPVASSVLGAAGLALVGAAVLIAWLAQAERHGRHLALVGAANTALDIDAVRALRLALAAHDLEPESPHGLSALHAALAASHQFAQVNFTGSIWNVVLSPDGERLVITGERSGPDGTAWLLDSRGHVLRKLPHTADARVAAISPGGLILVGDRNGCCCLYDRDGVLVRELVTGGKKRGDCSEIAAASFARQDSALLVTGLDGLCRYWPDAVSAPPQDLPVGAADRLGSCALSPRGRYAAAAVHHLLYEPPAGTVFRVWLFDLRDGMRLTELESTESVSRLEFAPDETVLLGACKDGKARLWNTTDGRCVELPHQRRVLAATWSPDGGRIATSSYDGIVQLWTRTGERLERLPMHEPVHDVRFVGKDRVLAIVATEIRLMSLTGRVLARFPGHGDFVSTLAVNADASVLWSGSYDFTARGWRLRDPELPVLDAGDVYLSEVACDTLDTGLRVAAPRSGGVTTWHGEQVTCLAVPGANSVALLPGGACVVGAEPRVVRCFERDGSERWSRKLSDGFGSLPLAATPDGRLVVAAGRRNLAVESGEVHILDATTGADVRVVRPHEQVVTDLAVTPDGTRFATSSWDGTAKVCDLQGNVVATTPRHTALITALALTDTRLATAGLDGSILLWDLDFMNGLPLRAEGHELRVDALAFSPDGAVLASACFDGTAALWSTADGKRIATLRGNGIQIRGVAFTPDGSKVLTASFDGTVRRWLVSPQAVVALARQRAFREFSAREREMFREFLR